MKVLALAVVFFALLAAALVSAQDPAVGSWVTYATANCPAGTRMTHYEATWQVPSSPAPSDAFYSPWIGSDTTDNLNLIQPVNPWLGSSWNFYTEYFQWSPEYNHNSQQQSTSSGNTLRGEMTYLGDSAQAYRIVQTDTTTGRSSEQVVKVQQDSMGNFKNYTVLYVVFEKYAECYQYPPDQKVTFDNIKVFCDGKQISPSWSAHSFQNNCDFKTHIQNPQTISITWSTSGSPLTTQQKEANKKTGLRKH